MVVFFIVIVMCMYDIIVVGFFVIDCLSWGDLCMLGLVVLGGVLEFYDFVVFVFFMVLLSELFFFKGMVLWLV